MSKYDFFFIISGNQTEEECKQALERVKQELESQGAADVAFDPMGKQKLAYTIGQNKFGYLINSTFELEPSKVTKLGDLLKQQPEVIRFQLIRLKAGQKPGKYTIKMARTLATSEARPMVRREKAVVVPIKEEAPKPDLTPEELDKKLEEILKEGPII